jgi:hypothetical protein
VDSHAALLTYANYAKRVFLHVVQLAANSANAGGIWKATSLSWVCVVIVIPPLPLHKKQRMMSQLQRGNVTVKTATKRKTVINITKSKKMEEVLRVCFPDILKVYTNVILPSLGPFFAYLIALTLYAHYSVRITIWKPFLEELLSVSESAHGFSYWLTQATLLTVRYQWKFMCAFWHKYKRAWFGLLVLWLLGMFTIMASDEYGVYMECYLRVFSPVVK